MTRLTIVLFLALPGLGWLLPGPATPAAPAEAEAPDAAGAPAGEAGGVRYRSFALERPDAPCVLHALRVPAGAGYRLRCRVAGGVVRAKAPLSRVVADEEALSGVLPVAGVNAGYFVVVGPYGGDPVDLVVSDGRLRSTERRHGRTFWVDTAETWHIGKPDVVPRLSIDGGEPERLWVVDGDPGELRDRYALYTPALGPTVFLSAGVTARAFHAEESWPEGRWTLHGRAMPAHDHAAGGEVPVPGDGFLVVTLGGPRAERLATLPEGTPARFDLAGAHAGRVRQATAGLSLVEDGAVAPWIAAQDQDPRHPRTTVGLTADGDLLLVVADGRQPGYSTGLSLAEAARVLLDLGAVEAINLDGGGSSTLWYDGAVRNRPSDGAERALSDALLVLPGGT